MGLQAPKLSSILLAAAFVLSVFCFTLFVWKSFGGPTPFQAHGYRMHVLFGSEASQLTQNADVRIAGVNVGKVIAVQRRGLGADALIELERDYAPLPRDARAILRYKTLLGETFVEMTPGSPDAPKIAEGGTLRPDRVGEVQQVDQVLGSFDAQTRREFKRFLRGAAEALDERGPDVNAALGHLAPTTEDVAELTKILDRNRDSLAGLVRDSATALRAIGARQDELRSVVTAGEQVFGATAARNRELTTTIDALPGFLAELRGALRDIEVVSNEAAPVLAALRPAIGLVRPALDETIALAPELEGTFRGLVPVIGAAKAGVPALDRILQAAGPALPVLYRAGRELVPVTQILDAYKHEVMAALAHVGAATQYEIPKGDGSTRRVLRTMLPILPESFLLADERLGSNRYNPYPAPGAVRKLADGLESLSCDNAGNPQTIPVIGTGAPPCKVAPPWVFDGVARSFPHLERDEP